MRRTEMRRTSVLQPGNPPHRTARLERSAPMQPGGAWSRSVPPLAESRSAATRKGGSASGRPHGFPPDVLALLDARDPWCVHCGLADGLQHHHRRLKGIGGDGRDHTQCACNGLRLCWLCHSWAHSGNGQREARAEGLIIPRVTLEPFTADVLVHLRGDVGGQRKFPTCDGQWLDCAPERGAA
jgi:hypothetical protein